MLQLEHRIPPPFVAALAAAVMWVIARYSFTWDLPSEIRWGLVLVFAFCGFALDVPALLAFRRAKTTVNPIAIDRATRLVVEGPFRFTRNPMYLGMVCLLLAWMFYLGSPLGIAGVVAFVFYITRFQIMPEEQVMSEKFGTEYDAYRNKVRRWI